MFGILCFGDSIIHGRGENPSLGWVGRLKNNFESKDYYNVVYNLGIPGDTTKDLLKRFEIEIKQRVQFKREDDRFIVMIGIGINDSRGLNSPENNEISPDKFNSNIIDLISIAKKYTSEIILVSLIPVNESLVNPYENTFFNNNLVENYNQIILNNSKKYSCDFLDIYSDFIKLDYKKLLYDGLHPNSKGYELMYQLIKKNLVKFNIFK